MDDFWYKIIMKYILKYNFWWPQKLYKKRKIVPCMAELIWTSSTLLKQIKLIFCLLQSVSTGMHGTSPAIQKFLCVASFRAARKSNSIKYKTNQQ
jgi:hypothetical protein